jgi:uncharacterized protein
MPESLVASNSRIEVIDVLRGFTLLGIAFVHFTEQYYAGQPPESHASFTSHGVADHIVSGLIGILISGKFFMIFSFLFGLSFYIQMSKSDGSASFLFRFAWRLAVLFLIGFVHHLHYRGDILTIYALLGFGLLLTYRLPDKALLIVSLLLVFNIPSVITRAFDAWSGSAGPSFFNGDQKVLEAYYNTLKSGTYFDILRANYHEFYGKFVFQVESGRIYITMGLFMLGLYVGRQNLFGNIPFFKKLIRYGLWTLLAAVLFGLTFFGGTHLAGVELTQQVQWLAGGFVMDVFNTALAAIYVGLVVTLFEKDSWKKPLMNFYAVGRMGLTTYLMQALVGFLVFFSVGLGMLGEIGNTVCLLIGAVTFVLQIAFSNFWLRRFQYGPAEWLWRTLTYVRIQPVRVSPDPT